MSTKCNLPSMFVKVSEVHEGSVLRVDGGFTCVDEGGLVTVEKDKMTGELYFCCRVGHHSLEGQIVEDEDGEEVFVGLYKA